MRNPIAEPPFDTNPPPATGFQASRHPMQDQGQVDPHDRGRYSFSRVFGSGQGQAKGGGAVPCERTSPVTRRADRARERGRGACDRPWPSSGRSCAPPCPGNPAGQERRYAVAFSAQGKGYVATGVGPSGYLNDLWQYDAGNNSWIQKSDFPGAARYECVAFTIGEYGYVGCGEIGRAHV